MYKGSSINLIQPNVADRLPAGRIVLPKGKAMRGLRMKCTLGISNTRAASATTPLTASQKRDLLANLQFGLKYGHQGQHQPFKALGGNIVRTLQRFCYGSEMEGYSNTVNGMARTLANGSTSTVVFYITIPVGAFYQHKVRRNLRGVGRSQAATMEVEAKFIARAFTTDAALTLDGNVTLEVVPDVFRCKGDHWTPIAGWTQYSEKDRFFKKDTGLPLLVAELSAVHASSALTNVSVFIDDELIHDQVSAAEILIEYHDNADLPAEGDVTDEWTVLYAVQPGEELEELSTGEVKVTQNVQDIATANFGVYEMPIIPQEAVDRDISAAALLRDKNLRAVSRAAAEGWLEKLPNRLTPYVPYVLFDQDDVEFERFPGKVVAPGGKPITTVPVSVLQAGKSLVAGYGSLGETKTAQAVQQKIAAAIPGAVQTARGFGGGGSKVLVDVSTALTTN